MSDQFVGELNTEAEAVISHFEDELTSVRTGRANTSMVERIEADAYGSSMPLIQLATLSTSDARTIVIDPWDKGLLGSVEKALMDADLGMMPNNDGNVIRLAVPELTEERRQQLVKHVQQLAEQARISLRNVREGVMKNIKSSDLSEDEERMAREAVDARVKELGQRIDEIRETKESELMTI